MNFTERRPINVGLIGFGNIGTGVVRYFQKGKGETLGLHLKRVAVADLSKPRKVKFSNLTDKPSDIFRDPSIDIVVELIGGVNPAREITLDAIDNGKSVVDGNKALLARHLKEIFDAVRSRQVNLGFEASVGGGIPIINIFNRLRGEMIIGFSGIVNGTDNYILTKMERGWTLARALRLAQEKGYAEADPTADIEGLDAQNKLAVLASLAFNTQIDINRIPCRGITGITPIDIDFASKYGTDEEDGRGHAIKLLAIAQRHGAGAIELRVDPEIIDKNQSLASVRDSYNAIQTEGELAGPQMYYGKGAGEKPTTSAVIADIVHVAENIRKGTQDELPTLDSKIELIDPSKTKKKGYIRVNLLHKPGSAAEVFSILGEHGLNIEDSVQRRRFAVRKNGVIYIPDIITFESAPRRDIDAALQEISRSDRVYGAPFFMSFAE